MACIAGITFHTEQTGGGCTAAVAKVEGGTIALTDGNSGTDWQWASEQGEPISAGFYAGTAWDDGDASHYAEGATPAAAVAALIVAVSAR